MRVATPTEPGARPTSLLGGSDSFLQLFPEAVALPVTPRILQHRRSGGFGGLSFSVAAVSTIAAVATAYLLLRCAFYLADARRSRAAQRLLAGAKRKKNKEPGEPCSVPVEDSAPAAPAASGDGEEALVERDLLRRARLYAVGLRRLVSSSECLLRKLNADLRAKCVALFSSLSLVEFSSLLSLLERRDRAGMHEDVSEITSRLWAIRESIGRRVISLPRHRHIKCLHLLLRTLTEVPPVTMAIAEKQRLLRIHQLLQLQEMALGQLNVGLVWLRTSLESTKTRGNAKAPAGGAETGAALAAADARIAEAVEAMGVTVRKRREQVLVDPLLSSWLRSTHGRNLHYGLISRSRLQEITIRPLQTHRELLEDLQASPLGSGNEPWGHIRVEDSDAPQAAVSAPGSPCRGDQVPPPEGPAGAPLPQRRLKHGSQGSRKKVGSTPATAVSSLPSTSTSAVVGANTAEKNHAAFQGSSRPTPVALLDASNIFSHVSPPASASGPQVASLPAAPQQASVPSARNRPLEATWVSNASGVTSLELASTYSLFPEDLPRTSQSSFRAAVSAASAFAPEVLVSSASGVSAPASRVYSGSAPASSWAQVVAHGLLPVDPHTWPPLSASSPAGSKSSPGASGPRFGGPLLPHERPHTAPGPSTSSFGAAKAPLSQARGTYGSALQGAAQFASASSGASASQRLPASTLRSVESHSSSETKPPGIPVDIYGTPLDFRLWGLGEAAPYRPVAGVWPSEEPDEPSQEAIDAGFEQLARLFSGAPEQHPGETMHPR